ncbi:energy-coupling factor transporter transmembrane component T [Oenococcus oeni]
MKPALKFILVFFIGLELAFIRSLWLNIFTIIGAMIYLLFKRVSIKKIIWIGLIGFVPFVGSWFMYFNLSIDHSAPFAWIMALRVYAYMFLGGVVVYSHTTTQLMRSFEQDLHMNPTFVYGILGALNFLPKMNRQIKIIRASGKMRGVRLTIFSPQLYVKAIYNSFVWSNNLSQAMYAHGFLEDAKRTHYQQKPLTCKEILEFLFMIILSIIASLIK